MTTLNSGIIITGETDVADNTQTDGGVVVTIPGDINGDGTVFWQDLLSLALGYQTSQGDPLYVPEADITCDGTIFYQDLLVLALHYQESDP